MDLIYNKDFEDDEIEIVNNSKVKTISILNTNVKTIRIENNSNLDLVMIFNLSCLKELVINNCKIIHIFNLSNLEILDVSHSNFTKDLIIDQKFVNLKKLSLISCNNSISIVIELPNLTEMIITGCNIKELYLDYHLPKLEKLCFKDNKMESFKSKHAFTKLKELHLVDESLIRPYFSFDYSGKDGLKDFYIHTNVEYPVDIFYWIKYAIHHTEEGKTIHYRYIRAY